jgi:hypothetical protein
MVVVLRWPRPETAVPERMGVREVLVVPWCRESGGRNRGGLLGSSDATTADIASSTGSKMHVSGHGLHALALDPLLLQKPEAQAPPHHTCGQRTALVQQCRMLPQIAHIQYTSAIATQEDTLAALCCISTTRVAGHRFHWAVPTAQLSSPVLRQLDNEKAFEENPASAHDAPLLSGKSGVPCRLPWPLLR